MSIVLKINDISDSVRRMQEWLNIINAPANAPASYYLPLSDLGCPDDSIMPTSRHVGDVIPRRHNTLIQAGGAESHRRAPVHEARVVRIAIYLP